MRARLHPVAAAALGVAAVVAIAAVVTRIRDTADAPPPLTDLPATDVADTDVAATNATVRHVIDGDTIDVSIGGRVERVRLIGIDTPESVDPNRPVECFGPEASARTRHLLPEGSAVRLERDVEPRDDYGRLLAYVHRADGLFVNLALVEQGYAVPLRIEPNTTHAAAVADAAQVAQRDRRGLWGACDG